MLKTPERKLNKFDKVDVLKMLYDLRASNECFGFIGHKKNMSTVIDNIIRDVKMGVAWRQ